MEQINEEKQLVCNEQIKGYLLETAKWGKFLAILGFVGIGLMVTMGVLLISMASFISHYSSAFSGMYAVAYFPVAVLYFFPVLYLLRYSIYVKQAVLMEDEYVLTNAFMHLKKFFKFMGILAIVILSLYALILVIAVPAICFLMPNY